MDCSYTLVSVFISGIVKEMETILEQQRRYHEERERLVDAMVKEKLHKKISVCYTLCKI